MEYENRLTLRQLALFVAVADHGSFAAAAEAVYLTPNAIAMAVQDLERSLGTHLCVRRRAKGVTLTPAGHQLAERARRLLREADDIHWSMTEGEGVVRGPVTIGCYSTLAPTMYPPLIEALSTTHPEIDLRLVDGTAAELLVALRAGSIDVMISYGFALPPDLEQEVLAETEVHALLSHSHRLADATSVTLHELAEDPLILLDLPPSADHTLEIFRRAGIRPTVAYRTTNFELVRSLVARDYGYSLLIQKPTIEDSYEGRTVVAKPFVPSVGTETVVISWPRGVRLTSRVESVIEHAQRAAEGQHWLRAASTVQPVADARDARGSE